MTRAQNARSGASDKPWGARDGKRFERRKDARDHNQRLAIVRQAREATVQAREALRAVLRVHARSRIGEPGGLRALRYWIWRSLAEGENRPALTFEYLEGSADYMPTAGEAERPVILQQVQRVASAIVHRAREVMRSRRFRRLLDEELASMVSTGLME